MFAFVDGHSQRRGKDTCLFEGNIHFGIAARRGGIHRRDHTVNITVNNGPVGITKNDDSDPSVFEVLLVLHVFIGGEQQIKPGILSRFEQLTID